MELNPLLAWACLWKNDVFLSPDFNQRLLDFCLLYSSSCLHAFWNFCYSSSSLFKDSLDISNSSMKSWWFIRADWAFFLSSTALGMFLAQLFKAIFTLLNFSSQTKNGEPMIGFFHISATLSKKSFLFIHRGLNRKGIGPKFIWAERTNFMG